MEVLANAMVTIILQYVSISNQYVVHLNDTFSFSTVIISQ